jgi:hypothetical protein
MSAKRDEIEARRAARQVAADAARETQRDLDLEALDAAEVEHGNNGVVYVEIAHEPGLPTMVIGRLPDHNEMKRYRSQTRLTKADGKVPDFAAAYDTVAASCRVYPPQTQEGNALYERVVDKRSGAHTLLGKLCVELAGGKEADDAKK